MAMNFGRTCAFPPGRREAKRKLAAKKIRLDRAIPFVRSCACKICGSLAMPFDIVDFNKYCSPTDCYEFGLSADFAAACYMRMGLWTVPCRAERREIVGEFRIGINGHGIPELITPALQWLTDDQDFGDRALGVAILTQFPTTPETLPATLT